MAVLEWVTVSAKQHRFQPSTNMPETPRTPPVPEGKKFFLAPSLVGGRRCTRSQAPLCADTLLHPGHSRSFTPVLAVQVTKAGEKKVVHVNWWATHPDSRQQAAAGLCACRCTRMPH